MNLQQLHELRRAEGEVGESNAKLPRHADDPEDSATRRRSA
jgi:hypothetical protein